MLIFKQIGLALSVFLLALLWLRIPDASALDVLATIVLGLMIVALAGAGESSMFLHLCARPATRRKLVLGTLLLLAAAAAWFGWGLLIDRLRAGDSLRAGYFNSRFPHGMRYFFNYGSLVRWQEELWSLLDLIAGGVLAAIAFVLITAEQPSRVIAFVLRRLAYWLVAFISCVVVNEGVSALVQWTPGHGLRIEMMSLVLRLVAATVLCASVFSFLIAFLAVCVRRADALYITPAGTPVDSQPRTADIP